MINQNRVEQILGLMKVGTFNLKNNLKTIEGNIKLNARPIGKGKYQIAFYIPHKLTLPPLVEELVDLVDEILYKPKKMMVQPSSKTAIVLALGELIIYEINQTKPNLNRFLIMLDRSGVVDKTIDLSKGFYTEYTLSQNAVVAYNNLLNKGWKFNKPVKLIIPPLKELGKK